MGNSGSAISAGTLVKVGMGKRVYIVYHLTSRDIDHKMAVICDPIVYKNGYASMHNPYIEQAICLDGAVNFVTRGECKILSNYNKDVPSNWKRLHNDGKYTWHNLGD